MDVDLQKIFSDRFSFMKNVYIGVGNGWAGLLYGLCSNIEQYYKQHNLDIGELEVLQIKEKWGGLRFHIGSAPSGVFDIIEKYESESYNIDNTTGLIRGGYYEQL